MVLLYGGISLFGRYQEFYESLINFIVTYIKRESSL